MALRIALLVVFSSIANAMLLDIGENSSGSPVAGKDDGSRRRAVRVTARGSTWKKPQLRRSGQSGVHALAKFDPKKALDPQNQPLKKKALSEEASIFAGAFITSGMKVLVVLGAALADCVFCDCEGALEAHEALTLPWDDLLEDDLAAGFCDEFEDALWKHAMGIPEKVLLAHQEGKREDEQLAEAAWEKDTIWAFKPDEIVEFNKCNSNEWDCQVKAFDGVEEKKSMQLVVDELNILQTNAKAKENWGIAMKKVEKQLSDKLKSKHKGLKVVADMNPFDDSLAFGTPSKFMIVHEAEMDDWDKLLYETGKTEALAKNLDPNDPLFRAKAMKMGEHAMIDLF